MLRGIATSLVKWITGSDVGFDLVVAVIAHRDLRRNDVYTLVIALTHHDCRLYLVRAPTQTTQHYARFIGISWFVQHLAVQQHRRVAGDDDRGSLPGRIGNDSRRLAERGIRVRCLLAPWQAGAECKPLLGNTGFIAGDAMLRLQRRLVRQWRLVHISRTYVEHYPKQGEQLTPAG